MNDLPINDPNKTSKISRSETILKIASNYFIRGYFIDRTSL